MRSSIIGFHDAPGVLHEWRSRRLMVRLVRLVLISCLVVYSVRLLYVSYRVGLSIEFIFLLIFPDPSDIRWPSRSFIP